MIALTGAALALGVAAATASYHHWRAGKLAALDPQSLRGEVLWSAPVPGGCRLLMIGDSRIAHWPLAAPSGWQVGKLGFPGAASGNIVAAARPVIARERPDAVLVLVGTNDATAAALAPENAGRILDRAGANVAAMLDAARASGARALIVVTVAPPIEPSLQARLVAGERAAFMRALTPRLSRVAARRGAGLIDAEAHLRDANGRLDPALGVDDLHWQPRAYRRFDRTRDRLLAGLPCPALSD